METENVNLVNVQLVIQDDFNTIKYMIRGLNDPVIPSKESITSKRSSSSCSTSYNTPRNPLNQTNVGED